MIEKLKEYMDNYNITQRQLASLLGISESHLSRLMSGKKKPGAKMVEAWVRLPGNKEKKKIRKVINYLMLEFSRGNFSEEQLQKVIEYTGMEEYTSESGPQP